MAGGLLTHDHYSPFKAIGFIIYWIIFLYLFLLTRSNNINHIDISMQDELTFTPNSYVKNPSIGRS